MQLLVQADSLENLIAHIGDKIRFFMDVFSLFWGHFCFIFWFLKLRSLRWILFRNWSCEKAGEGYLTVSQLLSIGQASFFKLKQEKRDCLASLWQTFLSVHQAKQEVFACSCFPALSDTVTLAMQTAAWRPGRVLYYKYSGVTRGSSSIWERTLAKDLNPQLLKRCEKGGVWSCWTSSVLCTCVTSPWRSE